MVDGVAVGSRDRALEGADDADGRGALEPEGVADRDHLVAHLDVVGVRERQRCQRARAGSTFSTARSVEGSVPTTVAVRVS